MDPQVKYLLSLEAIRERSSIVYDAAKNNKLTNFDFHPERLDAVATYVSGLIEVSLSSPLHQIRTFPPELKYFRSEILGLIVTQPSLRTAAGSILKLVMSPALNRSIANGSMKAAISRK